MTIRLSLVALALVVVAGTPAERVWSEPDDDSFATLLDGSGEKTVQMVLGAQKLAERH